MFQELQTPPSLHVVIEPHPDVLKHMHECGWYSKRGVKVLEGKWQDFVDSEILLSCGSFDVVYTDTFAENYDGNYESFDDCEHQLMTRQQDLRKFFGYLPKLLAGPTSRFSFFNGLGATSKCFAVQP